MTDYKNRSIKVIFLLRGKAVPTPTCTLPCPPCRGARRECSLCRMERSSPTLQSGSSTGTWGKALRVGVRGPHRQTRSGSRGTPPPGWAGTQHELPKRGGGGPVSCGDRGISVWPGSLGQVGGKQGSQRQAGSSAHSHNPGCSGTRTGPLGGPADAKATPFLQGTDRNFLERPAPAGEVSLQQLPFPDQQSTRQIEIAP